MDFTRRLLIMKKMILICDDDTILQKVYSFIFKKENIEILTLPNGTELFSTAKKHVPSLIILDVMMPEKDGITALEELHSDPVTASIPVIMVSAVVKPEVMNLAKKFGAKEFIEKPFNTTRMLEAVRKYIVPGNRKEQTKSL